MCAFVLNRYLHVYVQVHTHTHVYCGLYLKLTRLALSGHPNYCVRPSPSEFYYLFILFYFVFILETLQNTDSLGRMVSYAAPGIDRGASFLAPESPGSYLSLIYVRPSTHHIPT